MFHSIELIAVGNELLEGDVQDTNTHWLCQQLTGLGGRVSRAVMIEDDNEAIAREIRGAIERRAALIITTGGLGPTADDHTLQGVAFALGRETEENPQALAMLRTRYEALHRAAHVGDTGLTPARRKMACLPAGSEAVANPVGTAPAALIRLPHTVIVSLPGVPVEMKAIFQTSLAPLWKELFKNGAYHQRIMVTECREEALLAPFIERVAQRHERVYVKSRAREFGSGIRIYVTLSARGKDRDEAEHLVQGAWNDLASELASIGIAVSETTDRA